MIGSQCRCLAEGQGQRHDEPARLVTRASDSATDRRGSWRLHRDHVYVPHGQPVHCQLHRQHAVLSDLWRLLHGHVEVGQTDRSGRRSNAPAQYRKRLGSNLRPSHGRPPRRVRSSGRGRGYETYAAAPRNRHILLRHRTQRRPAAWYRLPAFRSRAGVDAFRPRLSCVRRPRRCSSLVGHKWRRLPGWQD